ncbi:MAG: hypothetical protein A2X49_03585 [Lentisphaerae bacterium GWF2_52_8]|nr:MAG: hypothetical protein A2X49_03585 [Lentisphaerae bacterium GWF2_52_8]
MKVLMMLRLYSHLEESMRNGRWEPAGMPAVYKLIEGLQTAGLETHVLLLCRSALRDFEKEREISFPSLPLIHFTVLPYANKLVHTWRILQEVRKTHPDIIYCDRAHVQSGALLSMLGWNVMLRLHGVASLAGERMFKMGFLPSLELLSYKAPFKRVLCSRDGSPGEFFMKRRLRKDVPRELLFNGVDPSPSQEKEEERVPLILSVGRLDVDKLPNVLLEAAGILHSRGIDFKLLYIGGGPLRRSLEARTAELGIRDKVEFAGALPHAEVLQRVVCADILVSLSIFGNNLNNAVLETLRAKRCIVTFDADKDLGLDLHVLEKEFRETFVLVDRKKLPESLAETLASLCVDADERQRRNERSEALADALLESWEKRIGREIDIIRKICGEEK